MINLIIILNDLITEKGVFPNQVQQPPKPRSHTPPDNIITPDSPHGDDPPKNDTLFVSALLSYFLSLICSIF